MGYFFFLYERNIISDYKLLIVIYTRYWVYRYIQTLDITRKVNLN